MRGGNMLKVLDDQLRSLANFDADSFHEEIAKHLNGKVTEEQIKAVKEFIFLLPPVLKQLNNYWSNKRTPHEAKKLSGLILTYFFHPNNFISEESSGLFGYIDDAYMVVSTFLRIEEISQRDWHEKSSEELDLLRRCRALIIAPRLVIPNEAAKIDELIYSMIHGETLQISKFMTNSKSEMISAAQ
jgi:uncharacterized membrane protein YkvA (DUF1232 family)